MNQATSSSKRASEGEEGHSRLYSGGTRKAPEDLPHDRHKLRRLGMPTAQSGEEESVPVSRLATTLCIHGHENPPEKRFCGDCGISLQMLNSDTPQILGFSFADGSQVARRNVKNLPGGGSQGLQEPFRWLPGARWLPGPRDCRILNPKCSRVAPKSSWGFTGTFQRKISLNYETMACWLMHED
jgi:hypothetical protein